jgi:biotin carboxyl carrier protein
VEGETFQVEIEGLSPTAPHPPRRSRPDATGSPPTLAAPSTSAPPSDNILRSPMPGRVMSILVRPGDRVSAGDEVCVVEAMKMEQSIRTPRDGVVKAVHVQPLDPVSADDPLVELE